MKEITERWRTFLPDIRYAISNLGRVKRRSSGKVRNPTIGMNGYYNIVLTYPKEWELRPAAYDIHTMVAMTWLGPRPRKYDVSHQNGNKLDNRVSNLKYESRKENSCNQFNKYSHIYKRVLTENLVRKIRNDSKLTNTEWARKLGVLHVTIWKVRTRRTWKHLL